MSHHSNDPDAKGASRGTTDGTIPVWDVAMLASKFKLDRVVVVGYKDREGTVHLVTWGKTLEDCKQAAESGNYIRDIIGISRREPKRVQYLEGLAAENEELSRKLDRLNRKVLQQIEYSLGVNARNVTEESAAKVLDYFRKWMLIDP